LVSSLGLGRAFIVQTALIVNVAVLVALGASALTPVRLLDGAAADLRLAFLAPPAREPVAVAAIDEASIAEMREGDAACACRAPVSEAYLAALLGALEDKGVAAIGIDLVLDEKPNPAGRALLLDALRGAQAPVVILSASDPALVAALPPGVQAASGALGRIDDFDSVLRVHAPLVDGEPSLTASLARAVGVSPPAAPFLVRWRAPRGAAAAIPAYPAHAVAEAPDDWLEGKIVLVGRLETDPAAIRLVEDQHLTPLRLRRHYAAGVTGVEAHAHILSQMLRGDRARAPGAAGTIALMFALAAAGAALGRRPGGLRSALGLAALGLLAYTGALIVVYGAFAYLLPFAAPALAFLAAFVVANRLLAADVERKRRFLEQAFARYLAPDVIADIVRRPERLSLTADRRDVTILSSDLQGFSRLAAAMPPERLGALMNAYFDGLIEILWRHGAMVDKLTGDGVLSVFGAPTPAPDHASRAIACAGALDAFAQRFKAEAPERFGVEVGDTRIGVESGAALVGNFGGRLRFDFTVLGEVVVRAARLEAANKRLGGRVLIGPGTAAAVGGAGLRSIGLVDLPGLPAPVEAFRTG
jgi:class 3 adenylate cyclase/CHASE2 domain-containing sensor protein